MHSSKKRYDRAIENFVIFSLCSTKEGSFFRLWGMWQVFLLELSCCGRCREMLMNVFQCEVELEHFTRTLYKDVQGCDVTLACIRSWLRWNSLNHVEDGNYTKEEEGIPSYPSHSHCHSDASGAFQCSCASLGDGALFFFFFLSFFFCLSNQCQWLNQRLCVHFYSQKSNTVAMFSTCMIYYIIINLLQFTQVCCFVTVLVL